MVGISVAGAASPPGSASTSLGGPSQICLARLPEPWIACGHNNSVTFQAADDMECNNAWDCMDGGFGQGGGGDFHSELMAPDTCIKATQNGVKGVDSGTPWPRSMSATPSN